MSPPVCFPLTAFLLSFRRLSACLSPSICCPFTACLPSCRRLPADLSPPVCCRLTPFLLSVHRLSAVLPLPSPYLSFAFLPSLTLFCCPSFAFPLPFLCLSAVVDSFLLFFRLPPKILSDERLRSAYDAGGAEATDEKNLLDSAQLFEMFFGSEKFDQAVRAPPRRCLRLQCILITPAAAIATSAAIFAVPLPVSPQLQ